MVGEISLVLRRFLVLPRCSLVFMYVLSFSFYPPQSRGIVPFYQNKRSKVREASYFMPQGRMQRIPFSEGWAYAQEPGFPVANDDDDEIVFEEPPASPDPSSADTSCYEITASGVISESSSIPTSGLPTPPPTVTPPVPIAALIRAAARRLQDAAQGAAPDAAQDAAPDAAPDAAQDAAQDAGQDTAPDAAPDADRDTARAAVLTPSPLRRSARIRKRVRRAEAAESAASARARLRRAPQKVAKMSTGGARKY